jgi:hypothetical protein
MIDHHVVCSSQDQLRTRMCDLDNLFLPVQKTLTIMYTRSYAYSILLICRKLSSSRVSNILSNSRVSNRLSSTLIKRSID